MSQGLIEPSAAVAELSWRLYPDLFGERIELQSLGGPFKSTQLAAFLCRTIADALFAGSARIIINVAPRRGKSEAISFATPTWFLEHFPRKRAILGTHTADLSIDYGRRIRNEFATNPKLHTELSLDSKRADQWNTSLGGGLKCVGVGGTIMGFGGDLIVVDDAHRGWNEAQSPAERKRVIEWFDGTLMGRLEPGGSVIVVHQRLNRHDLTGHLLKNSKEHWTVIRLPALAEENDPMGRAVGDPVCPERFDKAAEERVQRTMPRVMYACQFAQNPDEVSDGRAYGSFKPEHECSAVKLRNDLPLQLYWDFNRNPGTHCLVGQYDRRADQFIVRHELFGERDGSPETMKSLKALFEREGILRDGRFQFPSCEVFGDASGQRELATASTDTDYAIIKRDLTEMNVPFRLRIPPGNPPIKERMLAVNDALIGPGGVQHVRIHPDCERLITDFREVMQDEDGLIDKDTNKELTHPSDAFGYAVQIQRPVLKMKRFGGRVLTAASVRNRQQ